MICGDLQSKIQNSLNCRLIYMFRFRFGLIFFVGNWMIILNISYEWLAGWKVVLPQMLHNLAKPFSLNIISVSLTIQLNPLEFLQYLLKWFYEISNFADDTAAESS